MGFTVGISDDFPYAVNESSAIFMPLVTVIDEPIKRDIGWTAALDRSTKMQGYFVGTVNGVLRFYPGAHWPTDSDMYDCRLQSWFLQVATSRHDIAFLIDRSGSVSGITLRTIKRVSKLLINVIPESHRFNVFLFNNDTVPLLDSCGDTASPFDPLPPTRRVKSAMLEALDGIEAKLPGLFNEALLTLQSSFFNKSLADKTCKRMIVLFTDGKIDFSVEKVKQTLQSLNVRLLVLDFSSPLSRGPNKQLQEMACAVKGHYVFVQRISDWFAVSDMFFDTVCARSLLTEPNFTGPVISEPTTTFYNRKSMVMSHALFNRSTDQPEFSAVLGTEILLRDFELSPMDHGGLIYDWVTLQSGQIIRHPQLRNSGNILIEEFMIPIPFSYTPAPSYALYPGEDPTTSPVLKLGKVMRRSFNVSLLGTLNFTLVVPSNDEIVVRLGESGNRTWKEELRDADLILPELQRKDTLFIRVTPTQEYTFDRPLATFVGCGVGAQTAILKRICPEINITAIPVARDLLTTQPAFNRWQILSKDPHPAYTRGNFLITHNGVLRSTIKEIQSPIPRDHGPWREFASDPDRFPNETLLVTPDPSNRTLLSKSIKGRGRVLAVMGVQLRKTYLSRMVSELQRSYNLKDGYTAYLLDHRGSIVYSDEVPVGTFFGEIKPVAFGKLLNKNYFTALSFMDCSRECEQDTEQPASSSFTPRPILIKNILRGVISILISLSSSVLAFIHPDATVVKQCCRDIHVYQRNFEKTNSFIESYNKCEGAQVSCIEEIAVHPIPDTNLILILTVKTSSPSCGCEMEPVLRATPAMNKSTCNTDSLQTADLCFEDVHNEAGNYSHNACLLDL
eukprot:sb/3462050/